MVIIIVYVGKNDLKKEDDYLKIKIKVDLKNEVKNENLNEY